MTGGDVVPAKAEEPFSVLDEVNVYRANRKQRHLLPVILDTDSAILYD